MYEVYRRWPNPVEVITHDYYHAPPNTPEFPTVPPPPNGIDHVADPNLRMDRRDIFIPNWGLEHPSRLLRYTRMTRAVHARLRKHRLVRVHCTHAVPEVVSLIPLRKLFGRRLQVVCYAHGEEITACQTSRQLRLLMRTAHKIVDLMIANSQYTANLLQHHIDPSKVRVVHPGVELQAFASAHDAGQRWRKENNLKDNLIVLTVGRLDPRKNHAAVIQSIAALAKTYPQLSYIIAGQGRQQDSLKEQARSLGIADRVLFPGPVDGPTKLALYGACDVFAMPAIQVASDVEGFGIVFIEAGACGKPSLAGAVGGQPEAVIHGKTGLVVDGNDPSAVSAGLDLLLSQPPLRSKLGQAAKEHAATLDWAKVVQRTVQLVEEFLEPGPKPSGNKTPLHPSTEQP